MILESQENRHNVKQKRSFVKKAPQYVRQVISELLRTKDCGFKDDSPTIRSDKRSLVATRLKNSIYISSLDSSMTKAMFRDKLKSQMALIKEQNVLTVIKILNEITPDDQEIQELRKDFPFLNQDRLKGSSVQKKQKKISKNRPSKSAGKAFIKKSRPVQAPAKKVQTIILKSVQIKSQNKPKRSTLEDFGFGPDDENKSQYSFSFVPDSDQEEQISRHREKIDLPAKKRKQVDLEKQDIIEVLMQSKNQSRQVLKMTEMVDEQLENKSQFQGAQSITPPQQQSLSSRQADFVDSQQLNQKGLWKIQEIIKKRVHKGKTQYFIKWLGFDSKQNTWQNEDAILHLKQELDKFNSAQSRQTKNQSKTIKQTKRSSNISQKSELSLQKPSKQVSEQLLFDVQPKLDISLEKISQQSKKSDKIDLSSKQTTQIKSLFFDLHKIYSFINAKRSQIRQNSVQIVLIKHRRELQSIIYPKLSKNRLQQFLKLPKSMLQNELDFFQREGCTHGEIYILSDLYKDFLKVHNQIRKTQFIHLRRLFQRIITNQQCDLNLRHWQQNYPLQISLGKAWWESFFTETRNHLNHLSYGELEIQLQKLASGYQNFTRALMMISDHQELRKKFKKHDQNDVKQEFDY